MTFAEKLVRLRKREGMSQEALAERLGVSRQAVSRWEQGTALPDAAKLLPCARLFGVDVEWLLDDTRNWEDQNGTRRKSVEVVCDHVGFPKQKPKQEGENVPQEYGQPEYAQDFEELRDDDFPPF